ncbi:MAG: ATP-grasp domain-containing protein [Alphaproteobacteria bacterium]|nr:ATP-grasp domain-containing protein [Alphaproteobacteria bacterium]
MSQSKLTVLIASAGRRAGLVNIFRQAAARLGRPLDVIACDLQPDLSSACALADRSYQVPRCTSPDYIEALSRIVRANGVDLIVPTIDPELECLAENDQYFLDMGARVHVSSPGVIRIVRDKLTTMEHLARSGVPVPFTVTPEEAQARPEQMPWPLFMKPAGGSAGRGLRRIEGPAQLMARYDEPMVLQETLRGPEFTVNMFIENDVLRTVVPHERLAIRAGEVEKGRTVRDPELIEIAGRIAQCLKGARGVLCFQAIRDAQRGVRVFEINGRFGGGYPLADYAGARFAQWLLEECLGTPSSANDDWREGALMLRYDEAVYQG